MTPREPPRVCVTRDEPREGPLSLALRRHGIDAIACPVVSHLPPRDPVPLRLAAARLSEFDWIVMTSARAIEALARARSPDPLPPGPHWAAVGTGTRTALLRHGLEAGLFPEVAGVEGLLRVLEDKGQWSGQRVLVPHAAGGLPGVAEGLRDRGAAVTETIAYRTVSRRPREIRMAWRAARPRGAVLASPSAVEALVRAVGAPALARPLSLEAGGQREEREDERPPGHRSLREGKEVLLSAFDPTSGVAAGITRRITRG